MITHQTITQLMDAYFATYHLSYPFVHEATFRAQYNELIPRPEARAWYMLSHTVMALGSWVMGGDNTDLEEMLYWRANSISQDGSIFEAGSLTVVQALVLLSNFAQKQNKPNTGWNYLGLAVRMALSLGLHRELPEWQISYLQREMRRRVWWGLFIFDSGASTTFGRAILLPPREALDVRQVLNIHDSMLTPLTVAMPFEIADPTIYASIKAQADFHLITNPVSNRILCSPTPSVEETLTLNRTLETWTETLPDYFRLDHAPVLDTEWYLFARSRLWWRYWNMQIILLRPLLLQRAMRPADSYAGTDANQCLATDLCSQAALMTINSINDFTSTPGLMRLSAWYSL